MTPPEEIGVLPEGKRNDGLTRTGGYLRRKGWEYPAIAAELQRQNLRRCRPPLPDADVERIAKSVSRYAPGGPDPLEDAWRTVEKETHATTYERFVSLVRELQRMRPDQPIALPLERIAKLMGCAWTSVRAYRQTAKQTGLLYQVNEPIPHRRAAQYRVSLSESHSGNAPTATMETATMGLPLNHSGDSGSSGSNALHSGTALPEAWEQVARLARRGFKLFPCLKASKHPVMKEWQNQATSDLAKLEKWFRKYKQCNWALVCGADSGIFVLDVDGQVGLESFWDLSASDRQFDTLGVKTSRGTHLYFTFPSDSTIKNSVSKIGKKLDIRSTSGYVLVPPSIHPNGTAYEWLGGREGQPIVAAPNWLLTALGQKQAGNESALPPWMKKLAKKETAEPWVDPGPGVEYHEWIRQQVDNSFTSNNTIKEKTQ
jgi:hypothetical protein